MAKLPARVEEKYNKISDFQEVWIKKSGILLIFVKGAPVAGFDLPPILQEFSMLEVASEKVCHWSLVTGHLSLAAYFQEKKDSK